jgi:general secretion pathway protein I
MTASRQQRGFTLIEVLVAFMILAISLSVIFRIFSGGLRNVAISEDYAQAMLVAEAQLASAGLDEPLLDGVTAGEWDARFRWQRVVEPYRPWEQDKPLAVPLQAYRITISVDWSDAGQTRQVTLSSVRLVQPMRTEGQG